MSTTVRESSDRPHYPALDGLRGLAILMVLLHHSLAVERPDSSLLDRALNAVAAVGWIGVDLFFVLSGFLITDILLRTQGQPRMLFNFLARRSLRVLPLYYAVVVVLFLVLPRMPWSDFDWLRSLQPYQWLYWLHLANAGRIVNVLDPSTPSVHWLSTYWSLSVEEHFYLLWPLIVLACPRRRLPLVCAGGIVLALLFRAGCSLAGVDEQVIYYCTLTRFDPLLLGALLACVSSGFGGLERPARWSALVGTGALLAGVAWGPEMLGRATPWGCVFTYSLVGGYFAAVVLVGVRAKPGGWLLRLLGRGVLPFFGKYSYGLYVLNKPVFILVALYLPVARCEVLGSFVVAGLLAFIAGTALTLAAALCTWHLLEKRCLRLKRFFESRPAAAAVPAGRGAAAPAVGPA